ncbi:TPA: bifunctional DNA-formamidopyrimidine glycosylase/DNA-(apurinic or apyrimidinic site) lyase [Candidatus Nomurabacteria bacterium]|nr:MAG: Formamidopyrimidine-DNA glycosylase [Parcubacteria bacterium RAAC4_OD1_1]HCY26161.1 bifunctional DNA-formamidopyrimidine glycosylase/DNA-(apurinic or apyrimidinic site) lyase [Candidatus Nomurabacteria bacterium]
MPELPEVTTTVNGLKKTVRGLVISDVWTDLAKKDQKIKQFKNTIKNDIFFKKFKKKIIRQKIIGIERKAKNILIHLQNNKTILIHLKMTGHLLYGRYNKVISINRKVEKWIPDENEKKSLHDKYNRFVHVVFSLNNNKHLVMSDSRKFGKVTLLENDEDKINHGICNLGPEPLDKDFDLKKFTERLIKINKNIKTILMDQHIISGIGNIYSDEILWASGIHPESKPINMNKKDFKKMFENMKNILKKGIDFGGDSMSDYRNIYGERGNFQNHHNVYKKKGDKCGQKNCKGVIIRKVINGRSAHFCNTHQKFI